MTSLGAGRDNTARCQRGTLRVWAHKRNGVEGCQDKYVLLGLKEKQRRRNKE